MHVLKVGWSMRAKYNAKNPNVHWKNKCHPYLQNAGKVAYCVSIFCISQSIHGFICLLINKRLSCKINIFCKITKFYSVVPKHNEELHAYKVDLSLFLQNTTWILIQLIFRMLSSFFFHLLGIWVNRQNDTEIYFICIVTDCI